MTIARSPAVRGMLFAAAALAAWPALATAAITAVPPAANRTAGFTHFGVHVDDVQAVAACLRARGLEVGVPRIIGSGSLTVAVTDPDGNRLELSELPPGSPARKAMEGWK